MYSYIYALMFLITTTVLGYSFDRLTIIHQPCDRGPGEVVRSLVQGLKNLGIPFNLNPAELTGIADTVVILSDAHNVKRAVEWKKAGHIKHIFAGPNLMSRSFEHDYLLASPHIDGILVPSQWTGINFIQDDVRLSEKIKIWYAGIDEIYWSPLTKKRATKNVLIYAKYADQHLCNQIKKLLATYGWNPVILNYGNYTHQQYKALLTDSAFAIFLSISESQGISLAEAWAMNVPTLVWNPQELVAYGKRFDPISSCPYLTPDTGLDWKSVADLEQLLRTITQQLPTFNPRNWILDHMTDTKSALLLLDIIEETIGTKNQELS
jgi:hypothetical protein